MLDTTHAVETPEGVSIHLRLAGAPTRGIAWMIDWFIRFAAYMLLAVVLAFFGDVGVGFWLIAYFLGEWFYPVIFEVKRNGQTPGKSLLNLQVINDDGTPIGWGPSILRNLIRFLDSLPGIGLVGLVTMLCNRRTKRFGDMAAGTLVVYKEQEQIRIYADLEAKPVPPPVALNLEEQAAIVAFAERAPKLSAEREKELAALTGDLTGRSGEDAVQQLRRHAAYLVGRRA